MGLSQGNKRVYNEPMQIPQWLTSSASPQNISLLVKGLATFLIIAGADATVVAGLQNDIVSLITKGIEVVALVAAIYGGSRKLKLGRWSHPNNIVED